MTDVRALGSDRVVALRFGAGAGAWHLILELWLAARKGRLGGRHSKV